jgi:hypothetical protein
LSTTRREVGAGGQERADVKAELVSRVDVVVLERGLIEGSTDENQRILALGEGDGSGQFLKTAIQRNVVVAALSRAGVPIDT